MSRSGSGSPGPRSGSISGRRSCASFRTRTRTSSSAGTGPTRRPRRESPWTSRRTPRPRDLREGPLGLEELSLGRAPAGPCVVPRAAGGGDDPVAGHDEDRRIPGTHVPDGPRGPRLAEASREVPVRHDFPGRDRPEELEDLPLERGHIEIQRNVPKVLGSRPEVLEDPGEVRMVPAVEPLRGPRREVHPRDPVPPDREVDVEPEGREDSLALPLREGREEEPRGEELPVDVSAAEGDLGGQGRVGEDPSDDGGVPPPGEGGGGRRRASAAAIRSSTETSAGDASATSVRTSPSFAA